MFFFVNTFSKDILADLIKNRLQELNDLQNFK